MGACPWLQEKLPSLIPKPEVKKQVCASWLFSAPSVALLGESSLQECRLFFVSQRNAATAAWSEDSQQSGIAQSLWHCFLLPASYQKSKALQVIKKVSAIALPDCHDCAEQICQRLRRCLAGPLMHLSLLELQEHPEAKLRQPLSWKMC